MTKKKTALAVLAASALMIPGVFMLTACGPDAPKTHNFSEDWSHDANSHWHVCMDEGCDEQDGLGAHDFVDGEGGRIVCRVCGLEKTAITINTAALGGETLVFGSTPSEFKEDWLGTLGNVESSELTYTYNKIVNSEKYPVDCNFPTLAGDYEVKVSFAGDDDRLPSEATATFSIAKRKLNNFTAYVNYNSNTVGHDTISGHHYVTTMLTSANTTFETADVGTNDLPSNYSIQMKFVASTSSDFSPNRSYTCINNKTKSYSIRLNDDNCYMEDDAKVVACFYNGYLTSEQSVDMTIYGGSAYSTASYNYAFTVEIQPGETASYTLTRTNETTKYSVNGEIVLCNSLVSYSCDLGKNEGTTAITRTFFINVYNPTDSAIEDTMTVSWSLTAE